MILALLSCPVVLKLPFAAWLVTVEQRLHLTASEMTATMMKQVADWLLTAASDRQLPALALALKQLAFELWSLAMLEWLSSQPKSEGSQQVAAALATLALLAQLAFER